VFRKERSRYGDGESADSDELFRTSAPALVLISGLRTSLSCRRRAARRSASRPTCCKRRRAFTVINLPRSN